MKVSAKILVTVLLILLISGAPLAPCTLVSVEKGGIAVMGFNQDASSENVTKVWFREREAGLYGYMCFGFADGFAQGGMNDQGLVFGWVAGYDSDWKRSSDKRNYSGNLSLKILTDCSSIDEAVALYKQFNQPDLSYARTMLADRTGRSVIISWESGAMRIDVKNSGFQTLGFGAAIANKIFQKKPPETARDLMAAMTEGIQDKISPTLYSVVYDLHKREVRIFNIAKSSRNIFEKIFGLRRWRRSYILNLTKELKKGNHYYDLGLLPIQLRQPPLLDARTLKAIEVNPAALVRYAGRFRGESGMVAEIRPAASGLLIEWPLNETVKAIMLRPYSKTRFFADYRDLRVEFIIPEAGRIRSTVFRWTERDGRAREERAVRIPEAPRGFNNVSRRNLRESSFVLSFPCSRRPG